jgi:hypothetical protein
VFVFAFLGVFFLMPLFYGHPFFDFARLGGQFSTLLAVFLFLSSLIASVSVVSYRLHRMRVVRTECVIFLFTFFVAFITLNAVIFVFIPAYWGHAIRLIFPIDAHDSYFLFLDVMYFSFLSLAPAVVSVLLYGIYKITRKWTV